MEETEVVTCFLRSGVEVLLLRRSAGVGSYPGRWGGVAGHLAPARGDPPRDPDAAARAEIREETGIDPDGLDLVRRGDPLPVEDDDLGRRWVVHPHLFDCAGDRAVETDWETADHEWVQPTAILDRETVPALWETYRRVGPTVETVRADTAHGSAYLSLRAVEVLRDHAAAAAAQRGDTDLAALAGDLLAARPAMTALRNRVNRTMARADPEPASVADTARTVLADAATADRAAAAAAADRIGGATVATISRSGTVLAALRAGDPAEVLIGESRPGREGVGVAEELAGECPVTLAPDAALPGLVERADAVLVGADSVLPDGGVRNKAGTYPLALAAARAGVPVYAAAAADKISPDAESATETADRADVYDGDAPLRVAAPLFEVTPADLVAGVVTEEGTLDAGDVRSVAERHRTLSDWNRDNK
ncbi:MAG: NUDIX domain-containing protein [Halobacteriaceae archaeon]